VKYPNNHEIPTWKSQWQELFWVFTVTGKRMFVKNLPMPKMLREVSKVMR